MAIALAAYAAGSSRLPDMPAVVRPAAFGGLEGDATGFYEQAREFMASLGRVPHALLAADALFIVVAAVALVRAWRRRPDLRAWLAALALFAAGLCLLVPMHWMHPAGAAVFGWPLVWGLAMLPYKVLGLALTPAVGWDVGTALSLAFVALTVVAVAYLGRNAVGSRRAGVLAAAFWVSWPLLVGLVAGHGAWANDQWLIDVGLHNYDEPLSTLLVTAGAALLLARPRTQLRLSLAGMCLGLATAVKISNALAAALALALLLARRDARRDAAAFFAGAIAFAPVVLAYWPKSYPTLFSNRNSWPSDPFDVSHVVSSWTDSSIFTPRTLAILVPLAVIGAFALRSRWTTEIVLALLLVNPVFYSFFANTAEHPRFLYASLPLLFTLWAAAFESGARTAASLASRSSHSAPTATSHSAASARERGVTS